MGNKFLAISALLLISAMFLLTGCNSSLPQIDTIRKTISKHGNYIFVQGHWKETECKGLKKLAKINVVDIVFDKNAMTCTENFACVYAKGEDKYMNTNVLIMNNITYKIVEWTDDAIRAVYNARVADIDIKLSVKDNFAERSYRETGARGVSSSDPEVYSHWVLE